ncbi:hypothetical protein KSD_04950 [Ktedonobacter sp. SOSP1-85]|nr:hypothetical protein [Ktedonobacter sp. SOSP1-85]GHO72724.1 hypothetical protein KSD_04950 [Ktedonobacter sp. SOSP1-85]
MLLVSGLGVVIGNWSGGFIADRFGAKLPLNVSLVVLALVFAILPLVLTTLVGALLALFVWGIAGSLVFIPQQHRLLTLAPQHANVILALNNSTLYLGIAGGSALGGVIVQVALLNTLGWAGAACALLSLLVLFLSMQVSERAPRLPLTPQEDGAFAVDLAEETALSQREGQK